MPTELKTEQEPLDIRSLVEPPSECSSETRAGNPNCGICLLPLSKGARPSNIDADPHDRFGRQVFGPKEIEASSSRGCEFCRNLFKFALSCCTDGLWVRHEWHLFLVAPKSDGTFTRFIFTVPPEVPCEDLPPAIRLCRGRETIEMTSTADDHVIDQAKLWWETCVRKHKCQEVYRTYKPTRLLRLEPKPNDTVVRLVTVTQPVQYVALSHRWSKETEEISLTSSNLHQRIEKGILVAQLPRLSKLAFVTSGFFIVYKACYHLSHFLKQNSVQDVVYVLRRFHVEYLWIDSLCIIQGDDGDWEHEAGSIGSIYKNATFTISATKSQGSHDSLFSDPTKIATGAHLGRLPGGIAVRIEEEPRHPFEYDSRIGDEGGDQEEYLRARGLLRRGWVYQEVLLSPRILFFLDREIMWRCQVYKVCQCARYDADEANGGYDKNIAAERESTGTHYVSRKARRQISSRSWANIIEDYGIMRFTYPEDRLPALAGIAEEFGKEKQWTYICGLWQENISEIMWLRGPYYFPKARPHNSENIPTWSWASMSSAPRFPPHKSNRVEFKSYRAVYNDKEGNPYLGDVRDAVLTIEGDVLSAKLVRKCDANHLVSLKRLSYFIDNSSHGVSIMSKYYVSLVEDSILNESVMEEPDVLLLGIPGHSEEEFLSCIVLCCADHNSGSYKRLGGVGIELNIAESLNWTRKQVNLV